MFRTVLHSKIHLATVTDCRLEYEGSLSLDEALIEAAGMAPYEQVHVSNLSNGERFVTYLIPAPRGSKTVMLNGPTARLGMPGDRIVIFSYKLVEEKKIKKHKPKVIILDSENNIVKEL
jgi:aspartate 1-decarboxylase